MKVLFLYLSAFSTTGGIQKFNRSFLKALHELSIDDNIDATAFSSHDKLVDEMYFSAIRFNFFAGKKIAFFINALVSAFKNDIIIIGHINLASVGIFIKMLYPQKKVILVAHGIEVWNEFTGISKIFIQKVDLILAVSEFTKKTIIALNPQISSEKVKIFHNTIDPYFNKPINFNKPEYLKARYNIPPGYAVMLTISRLEKSEKYKGYDTVIESLPAILNINPNIIYLIGGKADKEELKRVEDLIIKNKVTANVKLIGFINDKELNDHYLLSDIFIMPSLKEGFGIVFFEALLCGRKVIAGNVDGSSEALINGKLGLLVNPLNTNEIADAVTKQLQNNNYNHLLAQQQVIQYFGFPIFKNNLKQILASSTNANS
jgi:glycosyltransferase involved in cell wall biosynthesis